MDRFLPEEVLVARIELGINLREAAKRTGLTKETISDIERGIRMPHPQTLKKIAEGYGVPISQFLKTREEAIARPKSQAPILPEPPPEEVSEEERRKDFRLYREGLMDAHDRLAYLRESWAKDPKAFEDLVVIAQVFSLGAKALVQDEVNEYPEDAYEARLPGALARLDDLAHDIGEDFESSRLGKFMDRRRRQLEAEAS